VTEKSMAFEATRSFAYRFVRYTILPEVSKEVSKLGEEQFLLREIAWPIIDKLLTKEQQVVRVPKTNSEGDNSLGSIVRFYVNFLAKRLDLFESLGEGYFKAYSESDVSEDEMVDAALESGEEGIVEEAAALDGWIYVFSFPAIVKTDAPFPLKIGKTVGEVESRVFEQVKGSAAFEQPVILGKWRVRRVGPAESAIHNVLKARGKWREHAPGREWFDSTLLEVESIVLFVTKP
jgi:hypothetical protein